MEPILSVRDLKTYFFPDEGVVQAVDGASFDVYPGRTLGVVGESGCGKSVTARSILNLVEEPGRIVSGSIILRDAFGTIDITSLQPNGRTMREIRGGTIAYVFQEPMSSFSPVHTIGDQIMEAILHHRKMSRSDARKRGVQLLQQVGIPRADARMDEYAFQLSGGLRQRAMIATALACDPKILIADEPTTALDVTTQAQILQLLRELQAQHGMAIILITHNLGVVAEMANDVAVMYLGKIVEQGSVDDLFFNPKHPYTRALLRSIARLSDEPRTRLPTISGSVPHPYNRPSGCLFNPRCPNAMPGTCTTFEPRLLAVNGSSSQSVSCFLYQVPVGA
ncbi:MAG: ABC transporter ATP-binding protein [Chloroflexi bacterium]|nr:ABC transporter ATP-binding protein [Chloroflexota bacterium]MBV9547366.1 ABC transporter ATP-binding protein [Chloroflexota bacterium]